ncbi:MAG: DUF4190 domain-containing protein [bacterium]|nr:DUF4190 domain-containing protein [bacterium]
MDDNKPITPGGYSLYAILAFVFGFIFWPIGVVLGIIALGEIKNNPSLNGTALAWLGIVLVPILVVAGLLIWLVSALAIFF